MKNELNSKFWKKLSDNTYVNTPLDITSNIDKENILDCALSEYGDIHNARITLDTHQCSSGITLRKKI
ncbi:MAG: hypothetical protein KKD35_00825 [Elusimicrobia bacterium]|nr:hypothetical protein [Elusimicrobiota bacterium]